MDQRDRDFKDLIGTELIRVLTTTTCNFYLFLFLFDQQESLAQRESPD